MPARKTDTIQEAQQAAVEASKQTEKYWDATEVQEICTQLINNNTFVFPKNTPILYLFIDKSARFWGKCQKASEILKTAAGYEFVIVINHQQWMVMEEKQREILCHHELLHIGFESEDSKYYIVDHDVEEFSAIVRLYGTWRDSVKTFVNAANVAQEKQS